ncbi:MATE family efflux transporter [Pelagicoccus sp. SDUM812003]|uniref:MATE family efflux transporter n=1 Tax=Pelagicoccus sp. SDUM812003 TaxID=3041267 RepID=UPI00280F78D8|nr:MATE family efflux transporter [Pelagicoccus sp. SDUM812003]MDQ8204780.1 MATE family efflux transporter [Pelagicoccus sp. SDUM812003]
MESNALRTENLFKLTWPIFLQNTTNSAVMFVDFVFFSYLSDTIAGTVGQLLPVFWMGAFVIPVFAGTGISVASQYMGANRSEKVIPTYILNLGLSASLGTLYAGALWIFSDEIGIWLGMSPSLNAIGSSYLSTICFYFIFMGVMVAYNAILSSKGMTHWLMYTSFAIAGVNLLLNSLFVFVFDWGVKGVSFASVCSAAVSMAIGIWLVHRKLRVAFYLKGIWSEVVTVFRPMLRIGIPNVLEPFSYSVQQTIISSFIISMGVVSMAAHNYAGRMQMFQISFGFSLAQASQILMAHWMGKRRFEDVNRLFWKVISSAMAVAFINCILVWRYSDWFLSLFTDDPYIKEVGRSLLFISIFFEPARAVNIIGGFSLRTVGDARFSLIVGMLFIWGIVPFIYGINHFYGFTIVGMWVCFAADEIIRCLINLWRWQTGKWKAMGFGDD